MGINAAELILNADGSIYHLCLTPDEVADTIFLVGDPGRVPRISQHFDRIDVTRENREFVTHVGEFSGERVMVLSTGIGVGAIDIAINELDALVNIDFKTRKVKSTIKRLNILRLGTAGGLQAETPLGALCVSDYAFAFDGMLNFYQQPKDAKTSALKNAVQSHFHALQDVNSVYVAAASDHWVSQFPKLHHGITLTCAGFYGPQYRHLRGPVIDYDFLKSAQSFQHDGMTVLNYEMETAAILALSSVLGHNACSISAIVANRAEGTFVDNHQKPIDHMIETVLSVFRQ